MWKRTLLTLGAAAAALALTAPSAIAAAPLEYDETPPSTGGSLSCQGFVQVQGVGYVCFHAYGDKFLVGDTAKDDKSVAVYWAMGDGSRRGIIRNKLGAFNPGLKNKNLDEHAGLTLQLGTCDQTKTNNCRDRGDYHWYPEVDITSTT